jgi:hypothetical protein
MHGPMSSAVAGALVRHEHSAQNMLEAGLPPQASPGEVLRLARQAQLDVITTDASLAAAPFEMDLWFNRVIVFLELQGGEAEQDDAIDRLFQRYKRLTPGRLYTVTETRVKVRQLPSRPI